MSQTKYRAFGTKLLMRAVGGSTWLDQLSLKDIDGPSQTKDTIDVTTHDSADGYIERLNGLKDGGTVSFEVEWNYDTGTGTHSNLETAFQDQDVLYEFAVLTPGGKVNGFASQTTNTKCWRMTGMVTKLGPALPVAGSARSSLEVTVSGKVTYYPGP